MVAVTADRVAPDRGAGERFVGMSPEERRGAMATELVELRSVINAAEARSAELVAELSRLEEGHPFGCTSATQFLSWQAGLSTVAGKALLTVGERLGELPSLREAAMAGEVSVWQARAIASAATDDVEADALVGIAREATTGQLERACRHLVRTRRAGDDRERAAHRARRLRTWWDAEGRFRVDGELDAEEGALFATALERAGEVVPDDARRDAEDPPAARAADALGVMARSFLDDDRSGPCDGPPPGHLAVHVGVRRLCDDDTADAHDPSSGDASAAAATAGDDPAGGDAPAAATTGDDPAGGDAPAAATTGDDPADGKASIAASGRGTEPDSVEDPGLRELCRLGWTGVGVSDAMARRLGCDATIQAIVRDPDGNPLALGRTQRVVTRRLRRAVLARDGGCVVTGCGTRRFLHCHHVVHWADGGPTDLSNLAALCTWHHRMVHDELLDISMVDGRPQVTRRSRWPAWRPPPPPSVEDLDAAASAARVTADPGAARSRWAGDHIDWASFDYAYLAREPPNPN